MGDREVKMCKNCGTNKTPPTACSICQDFSKWTQKNNQAIKADKGKPRISLVPPAIIEAIAEVREYGTAKYGTAEAWRQVEKQRYVDALLRHTLGYMRNQEGKDEESGIAHIKHMACNIAFLLELDKEPQEQPYSRRSFTYEPIENVE